MDRHESIGTFHNGVNMLKPALTEVMMMFPQSIENNIKAFRSSFKVPDTKTGIYRQVYVQYNVNKET
jgi:hypothetical protein